MIWKEDGVGKWDSSADIQFLDIPDSTLIRLRKTMKTQQVFIKLDLIIFSHQYLRQWTKIF